MDNPPSKHEITVPNRKEFFEPHQEFFQVFIFWNQANQLKSNKKPLPGMAPDKGFLKINNRTYISL